MTEPSIPLTEEQMKQLANALYEPLKASFAEIGRDIGALQSQLDHLEHRLQRGSV